jgi:hypothetical protein
MSTQQAELRPLELLGTPRQLLNPKAARREVADRLLAVARGEQPLEHPQLPGELAAAFLRGYDDQESTQEAYARDLADWFVWLTRARVNAFDATLASIENYSREPLPTGRPPAPATLARRLACLSHFYRRTHRSTYINNTHEHQCNTISAMTGETDATAVAVITDIHGNLSALHAALARIEHLGIKRSSADGISSATAHTRTRSAR